jgi:hypothetical protein
LAVAAVVTALTACGVYSFGAALARENWLLAVVVNLVAVGGAAPTAWRWRSTPVTRWVVGGMMVGVLLGWLGLLIGMMSR